MNIKHKILLLDDDNNRRYQITLILGCYRNEDCCVVSRAHINKNDFEKGSYDLVLVHHGNEPERVHIDENDWNLGNARIIFFSGGFSLDKDYSSDGTIYVSATYIEDLDNLHEILDEVLDK